LRRCRRPPLSPRPPATQERGSGGGAASGRGEGYSRKAKSLSLLAESFMATFGTAPGTTVNVDASAAYLGVQRRRIYDVVNVLESVHVMTKQHKNQ
jgi:transcription factor E2F7/8